MLLKFYLLFALLRSARPMLHNDQELSTFHPDSFFLRNTVWNCEYLWKPWNAWQGRQQIVIVIIPFSLQCSAVIIFSNIVLLDKKFPYCFYALFVLTLKLKTWPAASRSFLVFHFFTLQKYLFFFWDITVDKKFHTVTFYTLYIDFFYFRDWVFWLIKLSYSF